MVVNTNRNVAVYCGASLGSSEAFVAAAEDLGRALGSQGYGLVYGAGGTGLMGVLARAADEAGAHITGIIPRFLVEIEPPYCGIDDLVEVTDMPTRRQMMIDRADAFVALPGGSGTLDEISEVIANVKLGLIRADAPCILVNTDGFYEGLRMLFDAMVAGGMMKPEARERIVFASNVDEVMEALAALKDGDCA